MSDQVLTSISKPFAAALASLQQGFANAAKEISTLQENVVSKQSQHESMLLELAQTKKELDVKRVEAAKTHSRQQHLQKELADCTKQLDIAQKQKVVVEERANKLEEQIIDIDHWKQKAAIAEQERANIQHQLTALRTALLGLTTYPKVSTTNIAKDDNKSQEVGVKESLSEHDKVTANSTAEAPSSFISALDASCVFQPSCDTTTATTTTESWAPIAKAPEPETNPVDSRYKTRLCHFHLRGDCKRGAKCMYAHSEQELRFNPGKYHKQVSAVAAMGFGVDIAVIGALFEEYNGNTERVLAQLMT